MRLYEVTTFFPGEREPLVTITDDLEGLSVGINEAEWEPGRFLVICVKPLEADE